MPIALIMRIAGAALIALALYLGYTHVKSIGYEEASTKYEARIKDYEDNVARKIDSIETLSNTLAIESRENNEIVARDIEDILKKVKGKPLVIVKDGECTPSKTFSDSIGELNKRANQAIKESQK